MSIQSCREFELRDMWINGTISKEDYKTEVERRQEFTRAKDALIHDLRKAEAAIARARALGYLL